MKQSKRQQSRKKKRSILGLILFLPHLDDIDNCLCHSSIIKYAEDTVIYVSGSDLESIPKKLNADILEVHNWLTDNDLSLNWKKGNTETMIFGISICVKKAALLNIQHKQKVPKYILHFSYQFLLFLVLII